MRSRVLVDAVHASFSAMINFSSVEVILVDNYSKALGVQWKCNDFLPRPA